jgi:hypothetical protein
MRADLFLRERLPLPDLVFGPANAALAKVININNVSAIIGPKDFLQTWTG